MNITTSSTHGQNVKPATFSKQKGNFATKTVESHLSTNNYASEQHRPKSSRSVKPCAYCQGTSHSLEECRNIMKIRLKDRYEVLKSKGLCFSCLRSGHLKGACQHKLYCVHCKKCHPSILHVNPRQGKENPVTTDQNNNSSSAAVSSTAHMGAGDSVRQALPVILVRLKSRNSDKFITTYAFLDSGSTTTFCSEEIARSLHLEGKKTVLNLTTIGQQRTENCCILSGLEVSDLNGDHTIDLPPMYTQPDLPISKKDIVTSEDLQRWPHLRDVHIDTIN
ncbi:uncharacterized protein LOC134272454 [Saccostrea cucullata]|uniref:uncharacterized protein LOC134272454 n=1 Tax=Saccostrea cuccullata TaxID=36930 RepID=UPI002ED511C6